MGAGTSAGGKAKKGGGGGSAMVKKTDNLWQGKAANGASAMIQRIKVADMDASLVREAAVSMGANNATARSAKSAMDYIGGQNATLYRTTRVNKSGKQEGGGHYTKNITNAKSYANGWLKANKR